MGFSLLPASSVAALCPVFFWLHSVVFISEAVLVCIRVAQLRGSCSVQLLEYERGVSKSRECCLVMSVSAGKRVHDDAGLVCGFLVIVCGRFSRAFYA